MIYIEILAVQFEHDMNSIPSQIQAGAGRWRCWVSALVTKQHSSWGDQLVSSTGNILLTKLLVSPDAVSITESKHSYIFQSQVAKHLPIIPGSEASQ